MLAEHGEDEDHAARAGDEGRTGLQGDADVVRVLLAGLQRSAAEAYAAITAADGALRVAAGQRVTAERAARLAAARHAAAARAAATHAGARPGPLAQLGTWFRAGREWRWQRPALEAALAAAEVQLSAATQALSAAKDEFTARVAARAVAAATLRRLTAECAAARARITAPDKANPPAARAAASLCPRDESR